MYRQRTLRYPAELAGVGLHSGRKAVVTVKPAPEDHGYIFTRVDLDGDVEIKAFPGNILSTELATTLGSGRHRVSTIEHLLSALYGLGIDNARIEVDGPEIPILDGSAAPFVQAFIAAGIRPQHRSKRCLVVNRRIRVEGNGKWAEVIPSRFFKITCEIDFRHPMLGDQRYPLKFTDDAYVREICRARTFGFLDQVEQLKARGFALGGSLENAVVIDDYNILNEEGLRFHDEFARHKVLDALGDLAVSGGVIAGHFRSYRGGHTLNQAVVKKMLSTPGAVDIIDAHKIDITRGDAIELPRWSDARVLSAYC